LLLLFTELSNIYSSQKGDRLLQFLARLILSCYVNDKEKNGAEECYRSIFRDWIHWLYSFQNRPPEYPTGAIKTIHRSPAGRRINLAISRFEAGNIASDVPSRARFGTTGPG